MNANTPNSILDWLSTPAAYPDRPASVQRVETHISCVFLTDRFAYKLKKPVRFDFLDFSTLDLRLHACHQELRLNRRLAPDVYLGLVAVRTDATGQLSLDEQPTPALAVNGEPPLASSRAASGEIVEWLVKMRRLPDEATLLARIRAGQAGDADAAKIAKRLADFYRSVAPLAIEPNEYRAEIERHVLANRSDMLQPDHALDSTAVRRIHGAQMRMLHLRGALFDARAVARRIVDGHGDLRPEHVYLLPEASPPLPPGEACGELSRAGRGEGVCVIDCIEFNPEFRRLDVADELSFLATECDFAGAEAVGRHVFDQTLAALGDRPPPELVAFYRSYRACVRAKVAVLRAKQLSGEGRASSLAEAQRHLRWADRYDRQLLPPALIIVSGLMGSGKSTLARPLAETLGAELLSTDPIRAELYGTSDRPAAYGEGHYRPQDRQRVYDEMFARAERLLSVGLSVVLDGAFPYVRLREAAIQIAARRTLPYLIVHCHCPAEVARQRIAARLAGGGDSSEARPDLFERQRQEEEPNPPDVKAVTIDATTPLTAQIEAATSALARLSTVVATQ